MTKTKPEDFEFKELLAQYRLAVMREEDDLSKRHKETIWTVRRQEVEAELLRRLGAAVSSSRPYEVGLNERLKDPVYAAAYTKALIEDGVSASPQPRMRCPKCGGNVVLRRVHVGHSFCGVQCPKCMPDGTWWINSAEELAQFFTAAPAQEQPVMYGPERDPQECCYCEHCQRPIHEKPFGGRMVWLDSDGRMFCGRSKDNKQLIGHTPKKEPPVCDCCGAGLMLDRGGFYDCFACGHNREKAEPSAASTPSTFPEMEVKATVALDCGEGGTHRACNNEECSKDYMHEGNCSTELLGGTSTGEQPPRIEDYQELCAELYQVAGVLHYANLVPTLLLDKLSAAQRGMPIPKGDLLPFMLSDDLLPSGNPATNEGIPIRFTSGAARPSGPSAPRKMIDVGGKEHDETTQCKYSDCKPAPQPSAEPRLPGNEHRCEPCRNGEHCKCHGFCKCVHTSHVSAPQPVSGDAPKVEEIRGLAATMYGIMRRGMRGLSMKTDIPAWRETGRSTQEHWKTMAQYALEALALSRYFPPASQTDFTNKENTLKPSIGRIVIYNHPGSSDGKYPPQKSPAIIQNVAEDGSVRLFVFGPKGQHMDEGLIQGDGPCQWNWPERV
jgi:hypothetical protein